MPRKIFALVCGVVLAIGAAAAATQWRTEAKQSTVKFIGMQAGAEFEGDFQRFNAEIRFDPKDLTGSRFDVTLDMQSVTTQDGERDDIIRGPDIFDVKKWPTAHFVAERFVGKGGDRYAAAGRLTIRDVTHDVPIEFTFTPGVSGAGAWLKGAAHLKRLDFGVGQGEWKDTQWVADDVRVVFALHLER